MPPRYEESPAAPSHSGHTTWRDSRVALIFYVPTKDIAPTIEKAREVFEVSDEFVEWLQAESRP